MVDGSVWIRKVWLNMMWYSPALSFCSIFPTAVHPNGQSLETGSFLLPTIAISIHNGLLLKGHQSDFLSLTSEMEWPSDDASFALYCSQPVEGFYYSTNLFGCFLHYFCINSTVRVSRTNRKGINKKS